MKIVCPQCAFERHVPEDRLPASSVIATCPHCQHRFRIQRPLSGDDTGPETAVHGQQYGQRLTPPPPPTSAVSPTAHSGEDDPLPPGAVIPGCEDATAREYLPAPTPSAPRKDEIHVATPDAARATTQTPTPSQRPQPANVQSGQNQSGHDQTGTLSTPKAPASRAKSPDGHSAKTPDSTGIPDENDLEYRKAAAAAYEKHAEEGEQHFALDNPWEHPEKDGYAASFYQTCVRVMFAAPRFFSGLHPDSPQRSALFFFLLVCVIQTLVERFWGGVFHSYFSPAAGNDPQLQQLLSLLAPQTNIFLSLLMNAALKTLELFLASALFFLAFKLLAPGKANYHLVFQVMAYSTAPALLCVVPVAGSVAGFIWGLACSLVGCRYALRLTWPQTILGVVPMYILGMALFLRMVASLQQAGIG